jgi:hypothetical protein
VDAGRSACTWLGGRRRGRRGGRGRGRWRRRGDGGRGVRHATVLSTLIWIPIGLAKPVCHSESFGHITYTIIKNNKASYTCSTYQWNHGTRVPLVPLSWYHGTDGTRVQI